MSHGEAHGHPFGSQIAPASLLDAGLYHKDGISNSPPLTGQGWVAGPGVSSGTTLTQLRVQASATRTGGSSVASYNGDVTDTAWKYWDGSALQVILISLSVPWTNHGAFGPDTSAETFDAATPATVAIMRQLTCTTTTGGNLTGTDLTLT